MAYDIADFVQAIEVADFSKAWLDDEQKETRTDPKIPAKLGIDVTSLVIDADIVMEDVDIEALTSLNPGVYKLPKIEVDTNAGGYDFNAVIPPRDWKVSKIKRLGGDTFVLEVEPSTFELEAVG